MESTNPPPAEKNTPSSGPGRLLHQARKDLRLAPEDVAQILHLSSKQIIALEQDDYNNLPGPTYIRGYLRSYAQLLGLSPEKVLDSYSRLTIPSSPISLPKSAPPPQITSSDKLVKAATLGVVVVVMGLVYLWWRSDDESPEQMAARTAAVYQLNTSEPAGEAVTLSPGLPSSGDNSTLSATRSQAAGVPIEPDQQAASSGTRATQSAPVPSEKPGTSSGQMQVSGMTLNVVSGGTPKPEASAPAARTDRARTHEAVDIPPGVPRARLVLHAREESWADVRDARDNKLLYENVPAGRSVTIEGVAPFNVFLGNADGVKVEFNGQNFDVSRYKRGQVARFTLGESKAENN